MNAAAAYASLSRFGRPVVSTEDVSLRLRLTESAASHLLARLAAVGLVQRIRHGLWSLDPDIDPLAVPEYLTTPFPAYVSFQSALHLHGVISQVPRIITVASLARTRTVRTAVGSYSIHRLHPELFGGYEVTPSGLHIATLEKALVDYLYLTNARSRLFARLPELELGPGFDRRSVRRWVKRVPSLPRRTMVRHRLEALLEAGHRR